MATLKNDQLFKAASLIAAASILSKILGFFRETVKAGFFGATWVTDAFLVASMAPTVFFGAVTTGLTTSVIPVFTERLHDDGPEAAASFINNLTTITMLVCLVLAGVGCLTAPLLIRILAPGFKGDTFTLTVYLTRICFPVIVLLALGAIITGYLQALEHFTWPALALIPSNIVIILSMVLLARRYGIVAAMWGTMLSLLVQVLFMWPGLRQVGFRFRLRLHWQDPALRRVGRMLIPVLLAGGVGQFGIAVDRILASGLAAGSIAALNFGSLLTQFPLGIFVSAVTTVLFPTFSRYAASGDLAGLRNVLARGARVSIFLTLPIAVGLAVLRQPVVQILFQRGAFDTRATAMTAYAVLFFSFGLIPMALLQVVNRVYFSMQDTFTPMMLGMGGVAVNVALDLLLVKPLLHGGLALATSLAALVNMVLLMEVLRRRLDGLGTRSMLDGAWRMVIASAAMGLAVWLAWQHLSSLVAGHGLLTQAGGLAVTIGTGVVVYGVGAYILRLSEVEIIVNFTHRASQALGRAAITAVVPK